MLYFRYVVFFGRKYLSTDDVRRYMYIGRTKSRLRMQSRLTKEKTHIPLFTYFTGAAHTTASNVYSLSMWETWKRTPKTYYMLLQTRQSLATHWHTDTQTHRANTYPNLTHPDSLTFFCSLSLSHFIAMLKYFWGLAIESGVVFERDSVRLCIFGVTRWVDQGWYFPRNVCMHICVCVCACISGKGGLGWRIGGLAQFPKCTHSQPTDRPAVWRTSQSRLLLQPFGITSRIASAIFNNRFCLDIYIYMVLCVNW